MNRQYSGLLKVYQQEANDQRDKKMAEKQNRVMEERRALEMINKEMEDEKRRQQDSKLRRMNEQMEEYNQMLLRKQQEKERAMARVRGTGKFENEGTFKIGGENRQIKKKNYDEISDNLVLNPMRENLNSRGRTEVTNSGNLQGCQPQVRGKSSGYRQTQSYNIINHSNGVTSDEGLNTPGIRKDEERRVENNYNPYENQVPYEPNSYYDAYYRNQDSHFNPSNVQNNQREFPKSMDYHNFEETNQMQRTNYENQMQEQEKQQNPQQHQQNVEYNEEEFQKYYQEYIRKKMLEEEMAAAAMERENINRNPYSNNPSLQNQPHHNQMSPHEDNIQTRNEEIVQENQRLQDTPNRQESSQNWQNVPNQQENETNEIEHQMNNLNLNHEKSNKYLNNKMRNQYGYGYNHISHQPENKQMLNLNPNVNPYLNSKHSENLNAGGNKFNSGSKKIEEQAMYRNILNSQIQEKKMLNTANQHQSLNQYNTANTPNKGNYNPISHLSQGTSIPSSTSQTQGKIKISKNDIIQSNPYSKKNYNFGESSLSSNPITNPVNSYQFDYSRYRQVNMPHLSGNREISSARMRTVGNNIMK